MAHRSKTIAALAIGFLAMVLSLAGSSPPAEAQAQGNQRVRGITLNCPQRQQGFPSRLSFAVFEASGLRILVAAGGISYGDDVRLAAFLRTAGHIDEVWLDSPGGDASVGPHIGRVIRRADLATRVPHGFQCHSSCTLAFLGGVVRNIDPGGAYGVHSFYYEGIVNEVAGILSDRSMTAEQRQNALGELMHERERKNGVLAAEWQLYVQEMGVRRAFLIEQVLNQQSLSFVTLNEVAEMQNSGVPISEIRRRVAEVHCLDRGQQVAYNIVNVE
jgi:hypothetical protein